ncbi:MAG: GntR family transcriptional regulator [Notoacmeibacter sp.]|nr:GntR family transcriptional regulator [Notoacmeibacter sp.]
MSKTAMISPSAPIRRETFSNQVAASLRHDIIGGAIEAGSQITEMDLAARFGISRGPLREAMGQLAAEGLIVTVPYKGTHVIKLTSKDVREIYSLRTALETLAFQEIWDKRDGAFAQELERRHQRLQATLGMNDHVASSEAEIHLHSLVYEACGHALLLESWKRIAGRMQFYLAIHQRAHGRKAPNPDAHQAYVQLALGERLDLMLAEIDDHMRRGNRTMETYLADGT